MNDAFVCDAIRTPFGRYGCAIPLGHPFGASGARLVTTALYQVEQANGRLALHTMCMGQGTALAIERV
jgi:acetyl-CoA acyltransferase